MCGFVDGQIVKNDGFVYSNFGTINLSPNIAAMKTLCRLSSCMVATAALNVRHVALRVVLLCSYIGLVERS
jgi:hypothetical protein